MCLLCIGAMVYLIISLLCHRLPWPTGVVARTHPTHMYWAYRYMCKPGFMVGLMCGNRRCGINFWGMVSVRVGEKLNTTDISKLYAFILYVDSKFMTPITLQNAVCYGWLHRLA